MGVIVLQLFAVPEGKSGPQVIDILTKRVTSLGGVLSGSFMVDCETYTSVASLVSYAFPKQIVMVNKPVQGFHLPVPFIDDYSVLLVSLFLHQQDGVVWSVPSF
ncbi:hypothetical protein OUZ56_019073 [Daphnia magna]|uniref:Mediator of RNA polymerase II transcription subunit 20 n=1 Tax=Daphnia magna TaxID=35525 RepID=A0ABQ9ZAK3_9CRUS|nr:hypothetical protein OUZ56_019073 [Daphnia magna]